MKAKHRNSNRPNSLENSAESESVIRLILNAVFEEIVFSRRNFFSVIFIVKINPNALFKYKTYGTRRYAGWIQYTIQYVRHTDTVYTVRNTVGKSVNDKNTDHFHAEKKLKSDSTRLSSCFLVARTLNWPARFMSRLILQLSCLYRRYLPRRLGYLHISRNQSWCLKRRRQRTPFVN